jgi:hypothetical protein
LFAFAAQGKGFLVASRADHGRFSLVPHHELAEEEGRGDEREQRQNQKDGFIEYLKCCFTRATVDCGHQSLACNFHPISKEKERGGERERERERKKGKGRPMLLFFSCESLKSTAIAEIMSVEIYTQQRQRDDKERSGKLTCVFPVFKQPVAKEYCGDVEL